MHVVKAGCHHDASDCKVSFFSDVSEKSAVETLDTNNPGLYEKEGMLQMNTRVWLIT